MIVAGLGCRSGTTAESLFFALEAACEEVGIETKAITALATGEIRREEPGMLELAEKLGLPLHIVDDSAVLAVEPRTKTVSRHSLSQTGSSSLSEAAALVVAGDTSELIVPRMIAYGATCALAQAKSV